MARDGYSLKKVFDIIKPEYIKTHYIYAPRIIYYLIALDFKYYTDKKYSRLKTRLFNSKQTRKKTNVNIRIHFGGNSKVFLFQYDIFYPFLLYKLFFQFH